MTTPLDSMTQGELIAIIRDMQHTMACSEASSFLELNSDTMAAIATTRTGTIEFELTELAPVTIPPTEYQSGYLADALSEWFTDNSADADGLLGITVKRITLGEDSVTNA